MTETEYLESIAGRKIERYYEGYKDYPAVIRTADPLLIRVNPSSLLVDNTNFYIKIKNGLAFHGYCVYSSGLGTPIAEISLDDTSTVEQSDGTRVQKTTTWSDEDIIKEASKFLDFLEARISILPSTNAIKEAIDRFCWQLHYDITQTPTTTLPEGFSDVVIDTISQNNFKTLKGYFSDIDTSFVNLNEELRQDLNTQGCVLNTSIIKIASNLKDDINDTYTISKALRENNQLSVSGAVFEQTQLESDQFNNISNVKLGNFGGSNRTLFQSLGSACTDGGLDEDENTLSDILIVNEKLGNFNISEQNTRTLFDTIGLYAEPSSNTTISDKLEDIVTDVHSASTASKSADSKLGAFTPDTDTVAIRIGTSNEGETVNSLFGKIASVKGDTNVIGRDTTTSNKLWYDVIHNAGVKTPGGGWTNDSVYGILKNTQVFVPHNGNSYSTFRAYSSTNPWDAS